MLREWTLLKMAKQIYLNPESEKSTEDYLVNKFGKRNFELFTQLFVPNFAKAHAPNQRYKLLPEGIKLYIKMNS